MIGSFDLLEKFMPHGMCYQWRADILWLNVLSDAAIAIAYFSIPFALLYFLRRKSDGPFPGVIYMFCVFIFVCGLSHVMSIWTVWSGQYGLQGVVKALTALASVGTAVMLYPVMPYLLALRSPRELEQANFALEEQIEQRKITELQSMKLQADLARMGRITTMGQMATGLAHDLNQPLLAIAASTDTAIHAARTIDGNEPELYECLEDIQVETQRAGEIIKALRQFISKKASKRVTVDVNELVGQTVHLMNRIARGQDIELKIETEKVPQVEVDRVQIAQVLVNLIRNSLEAIATPGHSRSDGEKNAVSISVKMGKEGIIISVTDTGPGLAEGIEPFQAFETSKVEGMGLGLSISRDIIESHGGRMRNFVASTGGAGFSFSLPVAPQNP